MDLLAEIRQRMQDQNVTTAEGAEPICEAVVTEYRASDEFEPHPMQPSAKIVCQMLHSKIVLELEEG